MFNHLITASLKYRSFIALLACIMLVYGVLTANQLPVDVLPDLNRPTITIMTEAHNFAPEEVESQVTIPLERSLSGVAGLTRIRTVSSIGISIIYLEFDWATDIYRQRQLVAERLTTISKEIPENIIPIMMPVTSLMGEIMLIGISGESEQISPMQIRTIAEWTIRPRLLGISGISQITAIGGEIEQFQVLVEPSLMQSYGTPLEAIESSLKGFGQNTTGGFIEYNSQEFLIRSIAMTTSLFDLKNSLITLKNSVSIPLENLAKVQKGPAIKRGDASINGKPAVILAVQKQPGANTILLTQSIESVLSSLQSTLPTKIKIHHDIFRQSDFIKRSLSNVQEALRDGFIIVGIILIIFLANTRTTLISLSAIPISIILTLIIFKWFGLSINTMTLGGLAIAIGEIVDDAIVDVENIYRRLRENSLLSQPLPRFNVILNASKEIRSSIVYATLIVILVFIPLMALSGVEGRLFAPLGFAYMVSIGASLIVSLTLTPALSYYLLSDKVSNKKRDPLFVKRLKEFNRKILTWAFDRPYHILMPALTLLTLSLLSIAFINKGFLPAFNEGTLTINLRLPIGTSLTESNRIGTIAEKELLSIPEVKSVARRTGRAEQDEHAEGVNSSDIDVILHNTDKPRDEIVQLIRQKILSIPGITLNIGQPISHRMDHMLSGVRAEIVLKIFGDDLKKLSQKAQELADKLKIVPGLVDLQVEQQPTIPQLQLHPNRVKALLYGVNINRLTEDLTILLNGKAISQIRDGERPIDIILRLNESWKNNLNIIPNIPIASKYGLIPLNMVATVENTQGPNTIKRENQQRQTAVMTNTNQPDLSRILKDIEKIVQSFDLPSGYYIAIDGQAKSQKEATQLITILGFISLSLIYLVLSAYLKSRELTLIIMANIPMALIGGIAALWIAQLPLTVASLVGFITLTGIASRNGILKVSHYLHLLKFEGEIFSKDMIIRGSEERLTPVLMTATVAALALIPLLVNGEAPGKEILHPVAVVIFGGLISSTVLDTIVTPIMFWHLGVEKINKVIA